MKIAILGATGLLAKPVIKQLDTQGIKLRLFSRTITSSMFSKDYELVQGDVFNESDL